MRGIDISGHQTGLDFNKIFTDIVIIKATEGETYINPLLKMQYSKARAKGFKVGFYHFLRTNNPIDEAKHFLKTIEGLKSDCKYIIDCESEPNGASLRVRKFADYLISKGKEPALYTGLSFYKDEMTSIVKDLPLWVAAYCKTRPIIKSIGWQYSESLTIGGQKIDHNIFDNGILLTVKATSKPSKSSIFPRNGTVTTDNLNVRVDAGTGFKVETQFNKGKVVRVTKAIGANWYAILLNGTTRYVSSKYVKLD